MDRYRQALKRAGSQVEADPVDDNVLLVARQAAQTTQLDRALLRTAVAYAVVATVASLASWVGPGRYESPAVSARPCSLCRRCS